MKRAILVGGLILVTTSPSFALLFCSEPSAPYCASTYASFDDQDEFDDCKRDMESYSSDVENYVDCLTQASQDAISEFNNAVESFNRRARS